MKKMIIKGEQLHCLSIKTVYVTLRATIIYVLRSMFTWIFISNINIFNSAFHDYVFIHVSMYINAVNDTTGTW